MGILPIKGFVSFFPWEMVLFDIPRVQPKHHDSTSPSHVGSQFLMDTTQPTLLLVLTSVTRHTIAGALKSTFITSVVYSRTSLSHLTWASSQRT
jgi:hypothetical protein